MKVSDCNICEAASCFQDATVVELAKQLKNEKFKHLVIVDKKKMPIGIVSSVDIVNKIVAEDKVPHEHTAKEIMTRDIFSADMDQNVSDIYYGLIKRNIFFCPVTEHHKLKGTITIQEITKHIVLKPKQN